MPMYRAAIGTSRRGLCAGSACPSSSALFAALPTAPLDPPVVDCRPGARAGAVCQRLRSPRPRNRCRTSAPEAFVVREDGAGAKCCASTRATSPMPVAIARRQQPGGRADDRRHAAGADGIYQGHRGHRPDRASSRWPIVRPLCRTTRPRKRPARTRVGRLFHAPRQRGDAARRHQRDVAKGLGKREADRAAIVVVTTENIEFSTLHYRTSSTRCATAARRCMPSCSSTRAVRYSTEEARNRATVLDRGPRESAACASMCSTSMSFEARLRGPGRAF